MMNHEHAEKHMKDLMMEVLWPLLAPDIPGLPKTYRAAQLAMPRVVNKAHEQMKEYVSVLLFSIISDDLAVHLIDRVMEIDVAEMSTVENHSDVIRAVLESLHGVLS